MSRKRRGCNENERGEGYSRFVYLKLGLKMVMRVCRENGARVGHLGWITEIMNGGLCSRVVNKA